MYANYIVHVVIIYNPENIITFNGSKKTTKQELGAERGSSRTVVKEGSIWEEIHVYTVLQARWAEARVLFK